MTRSLLPKSGGLIGPILAVFTVVALWLAWAYWGVGLMHRVALAGVGIGEIAATGTGAGPSVSQVDAAVEPFAKAGQIGDLFGGVNALFAALACVGVFWAGWLQRQQLEDAREAYVAEKASRDQMESEAFFLQLLPSVKALGDQIVFSSPNANAPKEIDKFIYVMLGGFIGMLNRGDFETETASAEAFIKVLKPLLRDSSPRLEVFFGLAYQLFAWLDDHQDMDQKKRVAFIAMARAHLPGGLATMLGVFALQPEGSYFREAVDRYGLLQYAAEPDATLAALRSHYPPQAFRMLPDAIGDSAEPGITNA